MRWRVSGLICWLTLFLAGLGCGPSPGAAIVVFCSPDSPRMRIAVAGLEAALGRGPLEVVSVPEWGDRGAEELRRLRRQRPGLIVALGTGALMRLAPVEKQTPVVFAQVADPYFTGAAYDPNHPEIHQENITGLASPPPLSAALKQGASLLGTGSWGLLYDPNDGAAVQIKDRFLKEAPALGLKPLVEASPDASSDSRGLKALLAQGARVVYLPPVQSAARYAPTLLAWGREGKVLVVSGHPEAPPQGAVLRLTLDYHRLGEETGVLAKRVLSGEAPARIPIVATTPLKVEVDESLLARWSGYPPGRRSPDKKK